MVPLLDTCRRKPASLLRWSVRDLKGLFIYLKDSFPALFYTSAREIPTLVYNSSLKKGPLSGEASPYSPLWGVPPEEASMPIPCIGYSGLFLCSELHILVNTWQSGRTQLRSVFG